MIAPPGSRAKTERIESCAVLACATSALLCGGGSTVTKPCVAAETSATQRGLSRATLASSAASSATCRLDLSCCRSRFLSERVAGYSCCSARPGDSSSISSCSPSACSSPSCSYSCSSPSCSSSLRPCHSLLKKPADSLASFRLPTACAACALDALGTMGPCTNCLGALPAESSYTYVQSMCFLPKEPFFFSARGQLSAT
mmetsp:Transcript_30371/g.77441  ORF Transcript_30371/g.77441 Transcript_30371/m.77441 type:complete len:200 (+) Transcript_30371:421-1020(+)